LTDRGTEYCGKPEQHDAAVKYGRTGTMWRTLKIEIRRGLRSDSDCYYQSDQYTVDERIE